MLSITEQFKQDVKKKVKKKAKKLAATVLVPVICITVLIGGLYNSPFAIFFPSRAVSYTHLTLPTSDLV